MSDVDMGDSSSSVENRLKDLEGDEEDDEVETQPRKRSHSSDSEGDRDGDESDAPPKKKKHRPGAQFVDDIAINEDDEEEPDDESEEDEYDDDEEEEDLGDGEVDDGEDVTDDRGSKRDKKKNKKERHRAMMDFSGEDETMHMTLDNQRDKEEMAAMAKSIEDRYKDVHYDDDYDEDGANRSSSGAVLPSVRDPSLFLLRIGKGEREEDVLYQLLHQYYKRELDPDPSRRLHITSAFTTPASRGYIYVEAFREVHVEQAIKALPKQRMVSYYANSKKNIKVPITEMVAAIKFHSEQQSVQPKQWVRFKRGPNKDDLAQVVNVQDQGTIITLKFVPRIDFLYLEAKRKNDKLTRQQYKLQTASSGPLRRPIQKYFDERELRNLGFPVEKKRGTGLDKHTTYYHFMNGKYKNGFQFKDVKIDALETEHVNPSLAELERFTTRSGMDSDEDLDEAELEVQRKAEEDAIAMATAMSAGSKRQVVYSTGDRVQIIAGALRNVTGRVLSIGKDRLTIQADIANIPMPIEEVLSHVRKYFSIGAHVKVVSGVYKNETGMICHVPEDAGLDDKIAIHTDISARTIEVSSQDVVESSEVSTGRDTFGNYELHELVQLTNDVVGVIIRVHMASFYVLTNTGAVQQVKLQEIQNKRNDRFSHTPDKNGEAINRDDKVFILAGPERGKKASVKHIFKRTLFVHSTEVADNGGLFVIRGDQVALVGGKHTMRQHQQPMAAPRSPGGGARSPGPAPQSPRAASGFAGGQGRGFKKDPIIGKDVKITGGPYKGYAGVCLDVLEGGQARVEIRAMFRKISVPRNQIMEVEIVTSRVASNPFYGSQTPLVGGATPAHTGFGSATPGHDFGGSMTPSHLGSRTPSHADHDVWSAQTPAHRSDERQRIDEEEEEQEEWRVGLGLDSNNTIATPSAGSAASHLQPQTPGAVPPTPLVPPTPSADYAPQTPSTPYDEQAQQAAADEDEDIEHPPVAGIFTHPSLIGCQVTLRGGPATGTIVDIQAGGASVKVRPHAGGRVGTYTQTDLQPIQPGNNESAIFIQPHKTYAQYSRCSVLSTLLNEAVIDSGELVPLDVLCKIDSQDDEGEGQGEEKTKKKKGEKKK